MESYLNDEATLAKVSKDFSRRSNGVLTGTIIAIDECVVKIEDLYWTFDYIKNTLSLFLHPEFFALNVQCIVDHTKKASYCQ